MSARNWRAHHLLNRWTELLDPASWRGLTLPTMPTWLVTRPGSIHTNGVVDPDLTPPSSTVDRPRHEVIVIPYHPHFHPQPEEQILVTPLFYRRTNQKLGPDFVEALKHYANSTERPFVPAHGQYIVYTHQHARAALALEEANP